MIKIKGYELFFKDEDYKTEWISKNSDLLCNGCERLLSDNYLNTQVKLPKMKSDFLALMYGGVTICSTDFKNFVEKNNYKNNDFIKLDNYSDRYIFQCKNVISIDKELIDFTDVCDVCNEPISITSKKRMVMVEKKRYSKIVNQNIENNFYITDVAFGSKLQKAPILICSENVLINLKKEGIKGLTTIPIVDLEL
ncbi:hypothetical protein JXE04_00955 [Patescibacteria group bacterium]|nr:hypothetical protein [Patescibacteria group bacterium]